MSAAFSIGTLDEDGLASDRAGHAEPEGADRGAARADRGRHPDRRADGAGPARASPTGRSNSARWSRPRSTPARRTCRRSCCICAPVCARSSCRGSRRSTRTWWSATRSCTARRTGRRPSVRRSRRRCTRSSIGTPRRPDALAPRFRRPRHARSRSRPSSLRLVSYPSARSGTGAVRLGDGFRGERHPCCVGARERDVATARPRELVGPARVLVGRVQRISPV